MLGLGACYVKRVIDNFEKRDDGPQIRLSNSKELKLSEEDVHRVYGLPRGERKIDISACPEKAIIKLNKELGLKKPYSRHLDIKILDSILETIADGTAWTEATIIYFIYCLLCPSHGNKASLEYALVIEDLNAIMSYNWCEHVLKHVEDGINGTTKLNPTADFHFILINYLERMGKSCSFVTGRYQFPSLKGWDVKEVFTNLATIEKLVGYGPGVAVGYTKDKKKATTPGKLLFCPETCPMHKVPKNIEICKRHIEFCQAEMNLYGESLATLQGRLANDDAKTAEKAVGEDHVEKEVSPSPEKGNDLGPTQSTTKTSPPRMCKQQIKRTSQSGRMSGGISSPHWDETHSPKIDVCCNA